MIRFYFCLLSIFILGIKDAVSAQEFGSGVSVMDCPATTTWHAYHLYSPNTDEHALACGRISPVPICNCETPSVAPSLDLPRHVENATQIWADFIGKKSCEFMHTDAAQLDVSKFKTILNAPSSLEWAWPILLKQYLNLYSSIDGNLDELPKFCQIQKEISTSQNFKNLLLAFLESVDINIPLSEKIKIYAFFSHLFGSNPNIKEKLKNALKNLLSDTDKNNLSEKKKSVWYAFYHLNFTLQEFANLARPALGESRTALNITSVQALRILNELPLVSESRPALQRIWFETGDRELMDQNTMLDYISWVGLSDEMLFASIDDYLKGLESSRFNQRNSVASLITIISIKHFSQEQWGQILSRAYALTLSIPNDSQHRSQIRRARRFIIEQALRERIPYEKISSLVNGEIKALENSGEDYLERVSELLKITNFPQQGKDQISTTFVQHYFERMLRGERGTFTSSKNKKMRDEAFDFLKDKNLTAEGMRWVLSLYFNIDVFRQVNAEAIEKGKNQIRYSEARPGEYPVILQIIQNSNLSEAEKNAALVLIQ